MSCLKNCCSTQGVTTGLTPVAAAAAAAAVAVAAAAAAGRERATTGAIQIGIKDGTKAPQRVRGGGGSNDGIKMTWYHHKILYHGIMYFYMCTYLLTYTITYIYRYIDKYIYKVMGEYDKHGPKIPSFHLMMK